MMMVGWLLLGYFFFFVIYFIVNCWKFSFILTHSRMILKVHLLIHHLPCPVKYLKIDIYVNSQDPETKEWKMMGKFYLRLH